MPCSGPASRVFVIPRAPTLGSAAGYGALFGLVVYGVYDFTNYSTLRQWPFVLTLADVAWGTVGVGRRPRRLCGASCGEEAGRTSAHYPIRAVSKLTGIAIDTLRAWERRHGAVTPIRDDRGRMYTDADVARLRLLKGAVEHGHSIGRLAGLGDEELRQLADTARASRRTCGGSDATGAAGHHRHSAPRCRPTTRRGSTRRSRAWRRCCVHWTFCAMC